MPHTKSSSPPTTISTKDCSLLGIKALLREARYATKEIIETTIKENMTFSQICRKWADDVPSSFSARNVTRLGSSCICHYSENN